MKEAVSRGLRAMSHQMNAFVGRGKHQHAAHSGAGHSWLKWAAVSLTLLSALACLARIEFGNTRAGVSLPSALHTAVIYYLDDVDPFHMDNYRFFLRHGPCTSALGQEVDFFVLLSRRAKKRGVASLPDLPPGWKYWPATKCDRYAAIADLLTAYPRTYNIVFNKVVLLDSHVRGPILPVYMRAHMSWLDVFLRNLREGVALVSSTMMCAPETKLRGSVFINDPHALVFGVEGISALHGAVAALPCDERLADPLAVAAHMSLLLVEQQHAIDTLQHKYANVDWSLAGNRKCDALKNAAWVTQAMADPMETIFYKMTGKEVSMGWEGAFYASTASTWLDAQLDTDRNVDSNSGETYRDTLRDAYFCYHSNLHPRRCFNPSWYMKHNQDLVQMFGGCRKDKVKMCWQHFATRGAFEHRYGHFDCELHATRNFSLLVSV